MIVSLANAMMSAQANQVCGAGYGERSGERINRRNGYRPGGTVACADGELGKLCYASSPSSAASAAVQFHWFPVSTGFNHGGDPLVPLV
jgi:hypothetical protein